MSKAAIATDVPLEDAWRRAPWQGSHGMYLAGRSHLDGLDKLASEIEGKWGADRLRLLVSAELREKFDRQRYKTNQAIQHGDLEDVRTEAARMAKAWEVLDRAAEHAGGDPLAPNVWEVALANGSVAAIVPTNDDAKAVIASGRKMAIYTLEEIGRLLSAIPGVAQIKATMPGATVTVIRRNVSDPLLDIHDVDRGLDDVIPF